METGKEDPTIYRKQTGVERSYRSRRAVDLQAFRLAVGETDLWVLSDRDVRQDIMRLVTLYRRQLKEYIHNHPLFAGSLQPYPPDPEAPEIVQWMIAVTAQVGVGPMAAVAGAVAGMVGRHTDSAVKELIIENGGDIYLRSTRERIIGIYAGASAFSMRIGLRVPAKPEGYGICTSAGTVGPSLSFGQADATVICAPDTALADAAATAVGNLVISSADLERAVREAQKITSLSGAVVIKDDKMSAWGEIDFVPL